MATFTSKFGLGDMVKPKDLNVQAGKVVEVTFTVGGSIMYALEYGEGDEADHLLFGEELVTARPPTLLEFLAAAEVNGEEVTWTATMKDGQIVSFNSKGGQVIG